MYVVVIVINDVIDYKDVNGIFEVFYNFSVYLVDISLDNVEEY